MQIIDTTLSSLGLGAPTQFRNLAIFPLLLKSPGDADYLLLDEALGQGLAQVTEVSEHGSVPELSSDNRADKPVLLVDGEELVGAKQNRVRSVSEKLIADFAGNARHRRLRCCKEGLAGQWPPPR